MKNKILIILVTVLITNNLYSQDVFKNSLQLSCGKSKYIQNLNSNTLNTFSIEYNRNIKQVLETGITFNYLNYYIDRDLLIIENNAGLHFNFFVVNTKKIFWSAGAGVLLFKTKSNRIYFPTTCLSSYIYDINYGYLLNTSFGVNINKNLSLCINYKFIDKLSDKIKYLTFSDYTNYFIPNANRQVLEIGLKIRF